MIEFQYLGDLLAGCMIDHVYHEHRFFYSLSAFSQLANKAGLYVEHAEHTSAQGGSLRVVLSDSPDNEYLVLDPMEHALCQPALYAGMQARAGYSRDTLRDMLEAERDEGRVVAGWGATAKSGTLLNFLKADRDLVRWVEDLTPGKIGRCTPGTKIPIDKPDLKRRPDTYLLLAWNYLPSVLAKTVNFRATGGRLIIPALSR